MILITGDLHLSNSPRDRYRHEWQKQLRTLARELKPNVVLILGDVCEQKDEHSATLVNQVVEHFHQLSRLAPVIVLKGNHDYTSEADIPFWAFLDRIQRISWVGGPCLASDLENCPTAVSRALGGEKALFLPHVHDYRRDWAGISFKGLDWVFAHSTFTGAKGESGRTLEGVPTNIFPKGIRVISGDVHGAQTFGPVTYVGAPYTVDFGDNYDPRVLLITDKSEMKSIPCTGPQKRLLELEIDNTFQEAEFRKYTEKWQSGDMLKIRIQIGLNEKENWPAWRDQVRKEAEAKGFIVHSISPVIIGNDKSLHTRKSHARKSDEQILNEYVKKRGVDENTAKAGSWLMRQT